MTDDAGVLEVALIAITPGAEDDFETAFRSVRQVLAGTPGCRSVRMTRGIESPSQFTLLVEWDSVQAHVENFRDSERYTEWRAALGPHFASPPVVQHFHDVR